MTEVLPVTDVSLADLEVDLAADPATDRDGGVCVGRPLPGVEVAISALDARSAAPTAT